MEHALKCVISISYHDVSPQTNAGQSIEGMLRSQTGIHSIKVALLAERGVVEYDPNVWDADKIVSVSLHFSCSLSLRRVLSPSLTCATVSPYTPHFGASSDISHYATVAVQGLSVPLRVAS